MSLASVRPFFRSRLKSLGFTEATDAIDDQNVEQTKLDNSFQLGLSPMDPVITGQNSWSFGFNINVKVFKLGGRDNVTTVDAAWGIADIILADFLQPSVRLGDPIKNIVPLPVSVDPLSTSNDNDLIITLGFTGVLICTF